MPKAATFKKVSLYVVSPNPHNTGTFEAWKTDKGWFGIIRKYKRYEVIHIPTGLNASASGFRTKSLAMEYIRKAESSNCYFGGNDLKTNHSSLMGLKEILLSCETD